MDLQLIGKHILVTGGTKGIGAAVVQVLREEGARVLAVARTVPDGDYLAADVTTVDGCERVVRGALERLGWVDAIVHVAGGSQAPAGGFAVLDDAAWKHELDWNLLAAVRIDRGLVPSMIARGGGTIVHITSIQRELPLYQSTIAYAAAKAALSTYSKALSKEVGPQGVRVVRVAPGWVETEASGDFLGGIARDAGTDIVGARKIVMDALGGITIGRPGTPRELGELVAFTLSPRAAYVHGTEIVADGGTVPTV